MPAILLRLAGHQSYAVGRAMTADTVVTESRPTISAIRGLCAAALGYPRGDFGDGSSGRPDLRLLSGHVRVDNPGLREVDYGTVCGARPKTVEHAVLQAHAANPFRVEHDETGRPLNIIHTDGKEFQKAYQTGKNAVFAGTGAFAVCKRQFLSGAEFVVALEHPDGNQLADIYAKLRRPRFVLYLGRKQFIPQHPFVLGLHTDSSALELLHVLPKTERRPGSDARSGELPIFDLGADDGSGTPRGTVVVDVVETLRPKRSDAEKAEHAPGPRREEPIEFGEVREYAFPLEGIGANPSDHGSLHRAIMKRFPDNLSPGSPNEARQAGAILYSVHDTYQFGKVALVQSRVKPKNPDDANRGRPLPPIPSAGALVRFQLFMNPFKSVTGLRGKQLVESDEEVIELVRHRLEGALVIENVEMLRRHTTKSDDYKVKRIVVFTILGTATVVDPMRLESLRINGVGGALAYGCGRLRVLRAYP